MSDSSQNRNQSISFNSARKYKKTINICLTFLFSTYAEGQTKEAILLDSPQGRECTKIQDYKE